MSQQVYYNSKHKFHHQPGNNLYKLPANQVILGGAAAVPVPLIVSYESVPGMTEVAGAGIIFRKQGHYSFSLYFGMNVLNAQVAYHAEIYVNLYSTTFGQSAIVGRCKTHIDDVLGQDIIVPLTGAIFVNEGDSIQISVRNWDIAGENISLMEGSSSLLISSAY